MKPLQQYGRQITMSLTRVVSDFNLLKIYVCVRERDGEKERRGEEKEGGRERRRKGEKSRLQKFWVV